jgi:hypothetical protein
MTIPTYKYTIRTLMEEINQTYEGAYKLVDRMRKKGLVKDFGMTKVGPKNAKVYGLMMLPKDFIEEEQNRGKTPPPPVGFFSNPFNLYGAKDARYNT